MGPCPLEAPAWTYVFLLKQAVCMTCEMATDRLRPYWNPNAQMCVEMCPEDTPAIPDTKICQTCAQANPSAALWNPATSECVAECPEME